MALTVVCQLGMAAALLFIGVCLGMRSRPRVESSMHRAMRFTSIGLAVLLFILYVGESAGFGPSLGTAAEWVILRLQHIWQTGTSLLWSVF